MEAARGTPVVDIHPVLTPPGWQALRRLLGGYARELGVDLAFQGFAEELKHLPQAYAAPGGAWLATGEESPVGCVALRPLQDGHAELKRLYTVPAVRGRGVGRTLVRVALAEARARGFSGVRLDTLSSMEAALGLYAALGFVAIPPYRDAVLPGTCFLALDFPRGERCVSRG